MRVRTLFVIFFLLALLALVQADGRALDSRTRERVLLSVNGYELIVEIADSDSERIHGLSGREKLAADGGMLFVFPRALYHGIWMKDMLFPLDLIWLRETRTNPGTSPPRADGTGRSADCAQNYAEKETCLTVVDVKESVGPATYPKVFYPKEKAKYVLETRSGFVKEIGVVIGDVLTMKQEKTRR